MAEEKAKVGEVILLYDGVCGLCNRLTHFVLRQDKHDRFRFASLQSEFAAQVLARHGCGAENLETVYLLENPGTSQERLLRKSAAMLAIFQSLEGVWRVAGALKVLPRGLRDWGYDVVARNRYRIFGKLESCAVPAEKDRQKFIQY